MNQSENVPNQTLSSWGFQIATSLLSILSTTSHHRLTVLYIRKTASTYRYTRQSSKLPWHPPKSSMPKLALTTLSYSCRSQISSQITMQLRLLLGSQVQIMRMLQSFLHGREKLIFVQTEEMEEDCRAERQVQAGKGQGCCGGWR